MVSHMWSQGGRGEGQENHLYSVLGSKRQKAQHTTQSHLGPHQVVRRQKTGTEEGFLLEFSAEKARQLDRLGLACLNNCSGVWATGMVSTAWYVVLK